MIVQPWDSPSDVIRVFMIDDEPDHLAILSSMLTPSTERRQSDAPFEVHCFEEAGAALDALPDEGQVAIVCDYSMPNGTGLDWLPEFLKRNVGPVLIVTGRGDEEIAAEAMRAGAADYLIKFHIMENPESFRRAIREAVRHYALRQMSHSLSLELKRSNTILEAKHTNLRHLSYSMSHDLQTPLASLTGAVNALKDHLGDNIDDTTARWLNRIDTSTTRMVRMLDDLMVFAKAGNEAIECTAVDLGEMLRCVVDQLAPIAAQRRIEIILADTPQTVVAESNALYRVLCNVINNALKYIDRDSGGKIEISVTTLDDDWVRIRIADNGPGIEQSQLKRVLQPFVRATAKKTGTGLGLSIAKQYMDAFGGEIHLESDGSTGTAVLLDLRAALVPQREVVAA